MTAESIIQYLEATSHTVLTTPVTQDEGRTWTCTTQIESIRYSTVVYTDGENVIGFEDTAID